MYQTFSSSVFVRICFGHLMASIITALMKKLLCLMLSLLLILPPLPAQAWSEGGHHLISVLAFRQLPKDKQDELIRILKAHPCFEQDFKLPSKVRNADELLIGRAGYWPDVARSQPQYNRPNWHYQLGTCLNVGNVEPPKIPGPLPADATLATRDLYIAQAHLSVLTRSCAMTNSAIGQPRSPYLL